MAGWGTTVEDPEALIDYLVANFGDNKPPQVILTQDGSSQVKK
jgi:hypothetical protein